MNNIDKKSLLSLEELEIINEKVSFTEDDMLDLASSRAWKIGLSILPAAAVWIL